MNNTPKKRNHGPMGGGPMMGVERLRTLKVL